MAKKEIKVIKTGNESVKHVGRRRNERTARGLKYEWTDQRTNQPTQYTLPSITTVTKETFIVRKVFILKNSALYLLTAYDLPFFHAKFQNSGSNGLATIPI